MGFLKVFCSHGGFKYDTPAFFHYRYLTHDGTKARYIESDNVLLDNFGKEYRLWVSDSDTGELKYIDYPLSLVCEWSTTTCGFANKKAGGVGSLYKWCTSISGGFRLNPYFNWGQSSVYIGDESGFIIRDTSIHDKDKVVEELKKLNSMSIEYYFDGVHQRSMELKPKEAYISEYWDILIPTVESEIEWIFDLGDYDLRDRSRFNIKINGYEFK